MNPTDCQHSPKRGRGRPASDAAGLPGLRAALAARGWTQARLAETLDTSQPIVSSWTTGKHDPPARTVRRVAELLNTTADALLDLAAPADRPVSDAAREHDAKVAAFGATLEGRELEIFRDRIVADEPVTLQVLAARWGVSRQRAEQITVRLARRLRDHLNAAAPAA